MQRLATLRSKKEIKLKLNNVKTQRDHKRLSFILEIATDRYSCYAFIRHFVHKIPSVLHFSFSDITCSLASFPRPTTLFIQWQRLCHTGWRCSMLSFRLFQIGATNFAEILSAYCLIHLIAFIICCHPVVPLKSRLGLEEQPLILDPVTVLTATNISFITPS